ncbi:alkene reductase [Aromatoleum anaerobium]|uniref:Alkene reductase n=1 Tax=Aromatoleum anaerobium TaxID=182180 RepID=A0ABX1PKQ5_9RHOO|nr:alkene reductase [Aromatoleum anaerobium]MCK0508189.1 alkene reductase [Aromatoleum anaerobium]
MKDLFDPVTLGDLKLANRIVMAPMTRSRAGDGDVPTELMVEYYRQRASAGLIVAEGTQPSANGKGYCRTPGIHSAEQIAGWRKVTDAVHREGGCITLQIMHVGRIASQLNKAPGTETVAPSAIQAAGRIFTDAAGMVPHDVPRALRTDEIPGILREYWRATENALAAGFDGVELHCTSGYLPMQFLAANTNRRDDAYGGSPTKRLRFVVEALEAMVAAGGAGRVGLRICPANPFNDVQDDDPVTTYTGLLQAIDPLGIAYLHVMRSPLRELDALALAKRNFRGPIIANDSFKLASAQRVVAEGLGDAVSFGRYFIGNPDLVSRFREGAPLAEFDQNTLYTPGPRGYTDYPAFAA